MRDDTLHAAGHRRQMLLFLVAIVVPFVVLIGLSVRLVMQDHEMRLDRGGAERRERAAEVRDEILERLNAIRKDETRRRLGQGEGYRHAETVFVAWLVDNRLVLPWESDPAGAGAHSSIAEPEFQERIRPCEKAEFGGTRGAGAAACYEQAARTTTDPAQSAYARLLLSRVLERSGHAGEVAGLLRGLLDVPPGVADEDGVPIRFYAAQRLSQLNLSLDLVVARTREALAARPWLPPLACFIVSDISERLGTVARDKTDIEDLRHLAAMHVRISEQAEALQGDLARGGLLERVKSRREDWISYGDDTWLIGIGGEPREPVAVLVVSGARLLAPLVARGYRFVDAREAQGEPLGVALSGLKVMLPPQDPRLLERARGMQRSLLYFSLCLLAAATAFGAWLMWRDLRRTVRLAEMRGQFVSSVSHELKTPLTAIRMLAETLQLGRVKDTDTQSEYLDTIVNECERLSRLVDGVLQFSKAEQGKKVFHPRSMNIAESVIAAERALDYPLSQQGFQLEVTIEPGLPSVRADRDAVQQAILNLLSNAMKYSGESRRIGLDVRRDGAWVTIRVTDRGIGIAKEEQARIFEKFYRARTPENQRIAGTGLGLALVAQIVSAHGGSVEVESEPGKGSSFLIRLPVEENV